MSSSLLVVVLLLLIEASAVVVVLLDYSRGEQSVRLLFVASIRLEDRTMLRLCCLMLEDAHRVVWSQSMLTFAVRLDVATIGGF